MPPRLKKKKASLKAPVRPSVNEDIGSQPKPDPIVDDTDRKTDPDPGDAVDSVETDYEEYIIFGEELKEFGWLKPQRLAFFQEQDVKSDFIQQISKRQWGTAADNVLATLEETVLRAITTFDGNLNHLVATDPAVALALEQYEKSGLKDQPYIYVCALTHDESKEFAPFTVNEAREIAYHAQLYPDAQELAYDIDRAHISDWQQNWTREGARYFLHTEKTETGNYGPVSINRCKILRRFAYALFKIAALAENAGKSTVPVMHYIGYATKPQIRKQRYEAGDKCGNWLTQCVLAITKALKISTHMSTHPLFLVNADVSGPVAEMLLSRMTRAYYFAGGLNTGQASGSMAHIRAGIITDKQRDQWWARSVKHQDTPKYTRRLEQETRRGALLKKTKDARGILPGTELYEKATKSKLQQQQFEEIKRNYQKATDALADPLEMQLARESSPEFAKKMDSVGKFIAKKEA
ncbi:hypothetical protein E8E13_003508 [Curvularia kusanoi]|uniref:Uncharacterized protein n=1 Tax=Curvularia kusanoi TaxID=90978 RepID=A0A9P4TIL1_CURKU|nr:hypothetical protein E8E13_003508 [Curvularia kusanoi]